MQLADALLDAGLRRGHARISSRPIWRSPRSMSATRRPTSSRPRRRLAFNIRFNDTWTAETLQAEIHNRLDRAARRKTYRKGRKEPVDYDLVWRDRPSHVFLTRDDQLIATLGAIDRSRHRPHAGAVDLRRHVGRALHQGLLPGRRVRPGRQDHAHGRRARRACRPRDADATSTSASSKTGSVELSMPRIEEIQQYLTGAWRHDAGQAGRPAPARHFGRRLLEFVLRHRHRAAGADRRLGHHRQRRWRPATCRSAAGCRSCCGWPRSISAPGSCRSSPSRPRPAPSGLSDRFAHYVISSNWGSALIVWMMLPPTLLRHVRARRRRFLVDRVAGAVRRCRWR